MKTIKILSFIIVSALLLYLFSTKWDFTNTTAFDTISSFLSITTGFTITALSIIATSTFSKYLYTLEEKNNSKTLLHTLISRFKNATYIFISTIGMILMYKFFPIAYFFNVYGCKLYPSILLKSGIWYMTVISFITFLRLFTIFSKFVLKAGSTK